MFGVPGHVYKLSFFDLCFYKVFLFSAAVNVLWFKVSTLAYRFSCLHLVVEKFLSFLVACGLNNCSQLYFLLILILSVSNCSLWGCSFQCVLQALFSKLNLFLWDVPFVCFRIPTWRSAAHLWLPSGALF